MIRTLTFAFAILIIKFSCFEAQGASTADMAQLMSEPFVTSTEAGQRIGQLAALFESNGDRRGLFAHIYAITISATSQHIQRGSFENPVWVESIIVDYANIYRKTIYKELTGRRAELPVAWQYEFEFVGSDRWKATFDVIYGIKVHITRDLVEALYITPTNFNDRSIRDDFFRITTVLNYVMPDIWAVYIRYSRSMPVVSAFTESAVFQWISRLRAKAWTDAVETMHLTTDQKTEFLNLRDRESKDVRHFGILTILH